MQLGLDLLRGLADQEIARADAIKSRSRQAFTLAAAFFAVVQTVAYGSFVTAAATKHHRIATITSHTTWAVIALAACGICLIVAESRIKSVNLTAGQVFGIATKATSDAALLEFVELYRIIVEMHRRANRIRWRLAIATELTALASIGFVTWELLVALNAHV